MHTLDTRVATGVFDPGNPSQRTEVYYAGWPGQYASFYTNGVPDYGASVNLGGLGKPVYHPTCSAGCYYVAGHGCKCPPPPKRPHLAGAGAHVSSIFTSIKTPSLMGFGGFASWSPLAQAATIGALALGTYFATKKLRTKGLLGGHRRRRRRR